MINKSHWLVKNPTLFSLLCPLIVVADLLYIIYLSVYENGGELGGALCLLLILPAASIFAIDRVFAKFFDNKLVSLVEFFTCALVLYFVFK